MGVPEREVTHVDRKELYTSLAARVQYLHQFLDFNSDDVEALHAGAKVLKPLIPAVVNIVYKKLLSFDITARAFTTRSTYYEGPIEETFPDENSPIIKYRKMFLRGYLQKLCTDPGKFEFWEYLNKTGLMHTGQGRKHPLHVDFIHIGALLGFVQDIVFEAILSHPRLKIEQKTAVIKALGKVLWIQNDLFAKWYVRDGAEFKDEMDEVAIEKDGYLHGKKVVSDVEEGAAAEPEEAAPSGCPFSGMAGMGAALPKDHPPTKSSIPVPAKDASA